MTNIISQLTYLLFMDHVIKIFKSIDDLSLGFAEQLIESIKGKNSDSYFSLVLSGGSTPKAVFRYLAANFTDSIPWGKILIFWGDERCVEPENEESNFRMANESLLELVPIPRKNIFRIMGENEPSNESDRYSEIVKQHVRSIEGIPQFDLIMLGLGDDGHTASIFPGNQNLFKSNKLFEVGENPYSHQKRITATFKLINHASAVAFLVTGKSKAEMVSSIIERKIEREELPASMVQPIGGEVIWFLDDLAAEELDSSVS